MITLIARLAYAIAQDNSPVAALIERDPAGWTVSERRIVHAGTGTVVWVRNGAAGIHVIGGGDQWRPPYFERLMIWAAYRRFLRGGRGA